jgi:hypothetical protein
MELRNFIERKFEAPPAPPKPVAVLPPPRVEPSPLEEKIISLETNLINTRDEIISMQAEKESEMTKRFEEIYQR